VVSGTGEASSSCSLDGVEFYYVKKMPLLKFYISALILSFIWVGVIVMICLFFLCNVVDFIVPKATKLEPPGF
jgi:hypothetical protein